MTNYLLFLLEVVATIVTALVIVWGAIALWITFDLIKQKIEE